MKNLKTVIFGAFFFSATLLLLGCHGIKDDPIEEASVDLGDGLVVKRDIRGKFMLLQDGQALKSCDKACQVLRGPIVINGFDIQELKIGKLAVQYVSFSYAGSEKGKTVTVAALDDKYSNTTTDYLSNNILLGHNVLDACPGNPGGEPRHNGCCSTTVHIIGGIMYEAINRRDRDCRAH